MKILVLILLLTLGTSAQDNSFDGVEKFWSSLQKLCGKSFAGEVAAAPADDATFKGKKLVMRVISCDKNVVKIPFFVGDDKSRTWVFTKRKGRISLKHDHRHEDGKPDKVTMYGGWTTNAGSPMRQMFPADNQTVKVIAAAASNVWWIDLFEGDYFAYNLRRLGTERYFSIKFDLKNPIEFNEEPWGYESGNLKRKKTPKGKSQRFRAN